jgi:hypothetical protein
LSLVARCLVVVLLDLLAYSNSWGGPDTSIIVQLPLVGHW